MGIVHALRKVLIAAWAAGLTGLTGCTHLADYRAKQTDAVNSNHAARDEQERTLTTGVIEALGYAPTNPPTALALDLARHEQLLQGLPTNRLDVAGILTHAAGASDALERIYAKQEKLIVEKVRLERQLAATTDRLAVLGAVHEQEQNESIVRRAWRWLWATLGLGGIVAVCVLVPGLLPVLGRIAAWAIGRIPVLSHYVGLVGQSAYSRAVTAIQELKTALPDQADEVRRVAVANTSADARLVASTKTALHYVTAE